MQPEKLQKKDWTVSGVMWYYKSDVYDNWAGRIWKGEMI
jgi:hypothetical protein